MMKPERSGLLAGGNFIVDQLKLVDHYPEQDRLAFVSSQSRTNGGGPYNILKDLAAMGAPFPLAAIGMVGDDENGRWIQDDLRASGIDISQLHVTNEAATSYTDVFSVESTGRRTFFHQPGANALLEPAHFDFSNSSAKLFHYAYLMLLDRLDRFDASGSTAAASVLARARAAGLVTSVDMVSAGRPGFRELVLAALPQADHLFGNEIEAGLLLDQPLDGSLPGLAEAAARLLDLGVNEAVVLHSPAGAVAVEKSGASYVRPSLKLPADFSKGATGAGDAFAAGYLHGLHEGWPMERRLQLATCAAAACLRHPSPSAGLLPVADCLALEARFPAA
jgi:sugar/nucleoside kinase (ribokinase family)